MPPRKVDTSAPPNVPTSTPACPALIAPLLEMPPEKLETPVTRTPLPALALSVPVLAIDPVKLPTPLTRMASPVIELSVPLLPMLPEKSETLATEIPVTPAEMVPLLEIPPANVETGLNCPISMAMPLPAEMLFARIVPLLTMPPVKTERLSTKMPNCPPAGVRTPALTMPPPKVGVLLILRPETPPSTELCASIRMPPVIVPVSWKPPKSVLLISENPPGEMVPVLRTLELMLEFVKVSCESVPALVQPATVTLL